ncbi:DEK1 [Symbiodinium sp. CCMP2456]|nr:DEK1 [Symbiodinium sp. CCMP2456]
MTGRAVKATFGRFDRNGDGKISEDELVSVMSSSVAPHCFMGASRLCSAIVPTASAGKRTPVNVYSRLGDLSESECRELFKTLDKDGNGKLSVAEFVDYVFEDEDRYDGEGLAKQLGMEKPPTPISKPQEEAPPEEGSGGFMSQVGSFFGF